MSAKKRSSAEVAGDVAWAGILNRSVRRVETGGTGVPGQREVGVGNLHRVFPLLHQAESKATSLLLSQAQRAESRCHWLGYKALFLMHLLTEHVLVCPQKGARDVFYLRLLKKKPMCEVQCGDTV